MKKYTAVKHTNPCRPVILHSNRNRSERNCTVDVFPPPFGSVSIVWNGDCGNPRILRIFLSDKRVTSEERLNLEFGPIRTGSCKAVDVLRNQIGRLFRGEPVEFDSGLCDLDTCTPFQRNVLLIERTIPRGKVASYSAIAAESGSPNAARAVGSALAGNPFPLVIPCHRAVRSDGSLGGFQGGLDMKRRLLVLEGVSFTMRGCVDISHMFTF